MHPKERVNGKLPEEEYVLVEVLVDQQVGPLEPMTAQVEVSSAEVDLVHFLLGVLHGELRLVVDHPEMLGVTSIRQKNIVHYFDSC